MTQNIDDQHERGGSTMVTHLHGEFRKLRSSCDENVIFPLEGCEVSPYSSLALSHYPLCSGVASNRRI
ncbi:MAG: Sir2 family NAD-dependent protein deacetylase [Rikenellaceae bacterium]